MSKPLKDFRYKGIKLTIWPTSNNGYSCTLVKNYKLKDSGEWKETKSYFVHSDPETCELAHLQQLIADARVWIREEKEKNESGPILKVDDSDQLPDWPKKQPFDDSDIPF